MRCLRSTGKKEGGWVWVKGGFRECWGGKENEGEREGPDYTPKSKLTEVRV